MSQQVCSKAFAVHEDEETRNCVLQLIVFILLISANRNSVAYSYVPEIKGRNGGLKRWKSAEERRTRAEEKGAFWAPFIYLGKADS